VNAEEFETVCEAIAKSFHDAYEELAPRFGYETRVDSRTVWDNVPPNNRALMTATVAMVVQESPELLRLALDG
jgi:hypothetical protein